jgi:hypothetical protein
MILDSHESSPVWLMVSGSGVLLHAWPALTPHESDGCLRRVDVDYAGNGMKLAETISCCL